jgi:hypothetical protein
MHVVKRTFYHCLKVLSAAFLAMNHINAAAQEVPPSTGDVRVVTVSIERVLEKNFLGFGVEWEYEGDRPDLNVENIVWTNRWAEMVRRVRFMRPALLRVMHDARMYSQVEGGHIVPDYESPRMQGVYRILDFARDEGIPVIFGEWWLHKSYAESLGGVTSSRWPEELIGPFLQYLRERRHYTNICHFNLINEPGGQLSFEEWKRAILNLHAAFKRKGLDHEVQTVGTDGPGDWNKWIERTAQDAGLRDTIGAYEYHLYAHLRTDKWLPSLVEGKLETGELCPRRLLVNQHEPTGANKPFFMGEAGIDDGNKGDNQTNRFRFEYGVWMADYAIQSMRAGQAGLIAWDMDDAMHTWGSYGAAGLKGWGFWNSLAGFKGYPADDFKPRPWFYTWSLLCRLFPRGSQTIEAGASGDDSVRVAAARLPGGKGFSFAIVNEATTPSELVLRMPNSSSLALHEYRYFLTDRPVDAFSFPRVSAIHTNAPLAAGFKVRLPSTGAIFLSTQRPEAANE